MPAWRFTSRCVRLPIVLTLRHYTPRNRLADVPRAAEA